MSKNKHIHKQHDHECSYGHDQEPRCHERRHEQASVHISTHDGAVISSLKCSIADTTYDMALATLCARLKNVAAQIEVAGGLIGHIKAFAHEEARGCMISLTGPNDLQIKPCISFGISAECVCIAFGLTEHDLEELLKKELLAL